MKKVRIITISICAVLLVAIATVFAAFMYNQTISGSAKVGNIHIISKNFISFAPTVDHTDTTTYPGGKADAAYLAAIKQREEEGVAFTQDSVICYASEKEGYTEEHVPTAPTQDSPNTHRNYFYLNQLGFQVSFTADVDVYIRIHFSDAWIRTKTYNGNTQDPEYIFRDQFDVSASSNNWHYNSSTNTQDYTQLITASDSVQTFSFDIDDDYFYPNTDTIVNGHQSVMVQVSFTVDIIQANRAYKLWGYEPVAGN